MERELGFKISSINTFILLKGELRAIVYNRWDRKQICIYGINVKNREERKMMILKFGKRRKGKLRVHVRGAIMNELTLTCIFHSQNIMSKIEIFAFQYKRIITTIRGNGLRSLKLF